MAGKASTEPTPKPDPEPRCSASGCVAVVHARGLCEPHYQDLARGRGAFAPTLAAGKPARHRPEPVEGSADRPTRTSVPMSV